jgi:hypothetical protein
MPRKYIKRYIPKYKEDDIVVSIKDHHKLRYMKGDIFRIDEDYSDCLSLKNTPISGQNVHGLALGFIVSKDDFMSISELRLLKISNLGITN